jgi:drug/metabolite transporter (DMT)-like permease
MASIRPARLVAAPDVRLAVLWMTLALFSFLTMGFAGRELAAELTVYQILFFRSAVCLVILFALLLRLGFGYARTSLPARHVLRNVVHFFAQYGWFFAVASIPLAEVFAIEFTTPIWTALLASVFLGERLTAVRLLAIGLGFVGILAILRPGIEIIHPASLGALGAALGFAVTYVITKGMVTTERPLTILLWMNLVQLPIGFVLSLPDWTTPSPVMWPWLLAVGIAGLTSHYGMSRALAHADATVVVPLDFLRLPIGAVAAWLVYSEVLDPFVFLGAAVIFLGNWLNLRRG